MRWPLALCFAGLAGQSYVSVATTPGCEGSSKFLDGKIAASTIAFQGEVTAVDQDPAITKQKVTFRVLNAWKGPYQVGETVGVTVSVTSVCGGLGCVFPFKIGDVTLVISPSSQSSLPEGFGCWVYEGVVVKTVLWVPSLFQ
jgi:hypothetical protein